MESAARALILAIARARAALKASNLSRVVSVNGVAICLFSLLNALNNKDFTVTDRPDASFNNGGIGAALYNPLGRHSSTLSYRAIGGDPSNPSAPYYNHPGHRNGEGMIALVLHEALHLTPEGYDFLMRSLARWQAMGGTAANFFTGMYAINLERFINALTMQALSALGVPTNEEWPPVAPLDPSLRPEDF